jgi:hypothetical protein
VKIAAGVVAAALLVWLLFTVVFPRIDALIDDPAMVPQGRGQESRAAT